MVTPLLNGDTLDHAGLERLIEHILAGSVDGIFILGTTGEGPSLGAALKKELVRLTCRQVADRVPVIVGITDPAFRESVDLAAYAADAGAAAVVVAPPFYFPAGEPELLEYFQHLVPQLALPAFIYNMPAMTKMDIPPEMVQRLADIPGVVGYKDSSGNMVNFHQVLRLMQSRPDFSVLVGPEELLAESVIFGGHGGICGGANINPRLFTSMYAAARASDISRIRELQEQIYQQRQVYRVGRFSSSSIKGIKASLAILGICRDTMAEPLHAFGEPELATVRAILQTLHLDRPATPSAERES